MSDVYTYRNGEKLVLDKRDDMFVVREQPEVLARQGFGEPERMSAGSARVSCAPEELEDQMARARRLAPTHHAYQDTATRQEFLITDRIFVTFKSPLSAEEAAAFAGEYGLVERQRYSDRDVLYQLTDATGMNPLKLVVRLNEDDARVEEAENDCNHRVERHQLEPPRDPSYRDQWHLHGHRRHPEVDPRSSSRCEEAWSILGHGGGPDVVIAVTDDGCQLDHGDFDSPGKFAGWGYFVGTRLITDRDIDADPRRMYERGANHGTSCAGVAAAEIDGRLTVGAAPGCRLLPIKWESRGPSLLLNDSKLLSALDYLAEKVDVVSNSWGNRPFTTWPRLVLRRLGELAERGGRRGRGIVFLWAAGNENCPLEHQGEVEVPYTQGWELRGGVPRWVFPRTSRVFRNNLVGIEGVLHVAALASTARRSHYSNYGTGVDLTAPSSNVHTYSRLPVEGLGITTATGEAGGLTRGFGGTSSATPLVAGIAALVISADPRLTAAEVISLLRRTASKDLAMEPYPRTPPAPRFGDPDPDWDVSPVAPFDDGGFRDVGAADGTWSPWFGHGKVDAAAAVAAALAGRAPVGGPRRLTSSPGRPIPDADAAGVSDVLRVEGEGRVSAVRVSVDIEHTWIGDLIVRLRGPDGRSVVLHERAGANTRDLRRAWSVEEVPALAGFVGAPAAGAWLLSVSDHAGADTGVLRAWTLELDVTSGPVVFEDTSPAVIPDNDPRGVSRALEVPAGQRIRELEVGVDITHPWVGDLEVILFPPDGEEVVLQRNVGGAADNLVRSWTSRDLPSLAPWQGRDAGGVWQLRVADRARADVGKLNSWRLVIDG